MPDKIAKITVRAEDLASEIIKKIGDASGQMGQQITSVNQFIISSNREVQASHEATASIYDRLKEAIENPTGAAKAMASGLLENVAAAGEVGIAIGGVVTVAGAAGFAFAELAAHSHEVLAAMHDMQDVAGMSAAGVSSLKFAAEAAGGSLEGLNNMTFMFEQRMENSGKKVDEGLHAIGLSLKEIEATPADERILVISDALRAAGDETNKAAVAMDLFGRSGREHLPELLKPLRDLRDAAHDAGAVFGDEDTKAAEDFELGLHKLTAEADAAWLKLGLHVSLADQLRTKWQEVKLETGNLANAVVDAAGGYGYLKATWDALTGKSPDVIKVFKDNAEALKKAKDDAIDAAYVANNQIDKMQARFADYAKSGVGAFKPITLAAEDVKIAEKELDDKIKESIELHKQQADETKKHNEALQRQLEETAKGFNTFEKEGVSAAQAVAKGLGTGPVNMLAQLQRELQVINETPVMVKIGLDPETAKLISGGNNLPTNGGFAGMGFLAPNLTGLAQQSGNEFTKGFESGLHDLPNSIVRAIEGGGNVAESIGSTMGQHIGDSINASVQKSIGDAVKGGMSKASGALLSGLSDMIPVVGSLVGPAISALMNIGGPSKAELAGRQVEGDFQKQFGSFQKMMDAVGSAYLATGKTAKQAQADVKALMDAEKQGGDAAKAMVDKLNGALNQQKQDETDLNSAIQQYHFSIEELGPAMQKQKLTEQAVTLENQWRLLVGSGIDVTTVTSHMSDAMNQYLHTSMQTGQEVPAEMKPMIEKMIEMGTLTDANGNKITSLSSSGLTFSQTMTQGFDRVVDAINKVFDKLGLLPAAAQNAAAAVPHNPFADWVPPDVPSPEMPEGAATGGYVTRRGIEHFAGGGYTGPDTVPAMLAPGEIVLNANQQHAVRALMRTGVGGSAVDAKIDALHATMQGLRNDLKTLFQGLPIQLRHAMRGA